MLPEWPGSDLVLSAVIAGVAAYALALRREGVALAALVGGAARGGERCVVGDEALRFAQASAFLAVGVAQGACAVAYNPRALASTGGARFVVRGLVAAGCALAWA